MPVLTGAAFKWYTPLLNLLRYNPDRPHIVIFECLSSSLRFRLPLKAATRTERKTVRNRMDAGMDPECPRHEGGLRLQRVGPNYICSACGVRYARA